MYVEKIINEFFSDNNQYVFWGAGQTCKDFYLFCKNDLQISYVVDQNSNLVGTKILGLDICNPNSAKLKKENAKIIITTKIYFREIKLYLEKQGFEYNKDFFYYKDVMTLLKWYKNNEVWVTQVDIPITTRCTANCKDCSVLLPYYKEKKDYALENIKLDIDSFFRMFDGAYEFIVVGGEAFLHKNFVEIIEYVGSSYRQKIIHLTCITNGTIVPNMKQIEVMKKYNVEIQVSDYSKLLIAENRKIRLIQCLEENSIAYMKLPMNRWIDYGSPYESNGLEGEELKEFFNSCANQCRTLYNQKLYFCFRNCAAIRLGAFENNKNDYIDLSRSSFDKIALLDFEIGFTKTGYLTFCKNCNGQPSVNKKFVPAGRQIKF